MPVFETQIVVSNYLDVSSTEPANPVHGQKWMDGTIMKTWDDALKEWVLEDLKGESSALWIRYADDDKGNGFSASITGKKYVAMKPVINNPVPSDDPTDYEGLWGEFKGESIPGPPGQDGSIKWTWMRYADNVSGGGISAESAGKKYIGFAYNKDTATPSNVAKDYQWFLAKGDPGEPGENGLSITSVQSLFYQSTSATSLVGGTWVTTAPVWASGKYSWTKTKTVFSDSTSSETVPVNITGGIGEDGKPTYSWLMYAEDDKGKGISASPVGKYFMGLAHNKSVEKPSAVASDYTWSVMYDEEKMAELQEQINNLNYVGTNLWAEDYYDKNIGHLNADGSINPNVYYRYTDKIVTNGATSLLRTVFEPATIATGMRFTYFNSNDEVIWVGPQHTTSKIGSTYEKIPEGAVSFQTYAARKENGLKMKVELGNKPTDWSVSPLDTATTNDLTNVQTELQNRLDTIVTPVIQPTAPENPKEGMFWWQDDLKGDIIGCFKYISKHWIPQTIQQSMLNIIELNAVIITGSTITGSDIFGAKFINNFKYKQNEGTPIEWTVSGITDIEGKITMDWFVEGADDNGRMVISPEGIYGSYYSDTARNKMTGYWNLHSNGFEMSTGNRATNNYRSASYQSSGIMMTDQTKKFGDVNLKYSDLLSINDTALTASTDWAVYATSGVSQPLVSRSQGTITLSGAFKPLKNLPVTGVSESYVMAVLPPGLRPAKRMEFTNAGSGLRKYLLSVYPNGNIEAARNVDLSGYTPFNAGGFYSISCNFTAETV